MDRHKHYGRDNGATQKLRRRVLFCLNTCGENGNNKQRAYERGDIKSQVCHHEDRSDDTAGMTACLEFKYFIADKHSDTAEEIFQGYDLYCIWRVENIR